MDALSRRTFLGATTALAGMGSAVGTESEEKPLSPALQGDIADLVRKTPLVDTHEHLWEESTRLRSLSETLDVPAADFGMLFSHYADSDLQVAGMSKEQFQQLKGKDKSPKEKWEIVAPFYQRCRNTGYLQCVRESIRLLYGEEDICADNCEKISQQLANQVKPGFTRRILREVAGIEYAQVNNQEGKVFLETEQPDLLTQDISLNPLSVNLALDTLQEILGKEVASLKDAHAAIDTCFATYGPRAIAVKSQCAYWRRLSFDSVSESDAEPLFRRFRQSKEALNKEEKKALEDHLFHYCIDQAAEYHLPIKLHTGYYAGQNSMPLERVRQNAGDLCPLFKAHPKARFVLMHIGYPYQDEIIALAKHYTNVYADMCWAWIINPLASVRFLKEFLMAAPIYKLFTFGGDYKMVELVPGHTVMARRGITQALTELIREGWLNEKEAPEWIDRIMRGNARELFEYDRALSHWKK